MYRIGTLRGGENMRTITSERMLKGWSQSDLAKRVGVSTAIVSRWETGRNEPKCCHLLKLAKAFGCTTDYLVGLSQSRV